MKKFVKIMAVVLCVLTAAVGTVSIVLENRAVVQTAVIKQGSTDRATIRTIQEKLKRWGYYTGSVDGIYGSQTVAAVKYFQRKNGLTADGIVGTQTAKALGITLSSSGSSSSSSTGSISSSDLYLLAKVIYAEARGEPYVGKVAVGAVVLNRVKNANFPNTIAGVVYQPWAFTAVHDGQINLSPDETCKKAAQDALNGWDPTYGSIYYYNPRTATSQWIFSRPTTVVIGNHTFAK